MELFSDGWKRTTRRALVAVATGGALTSRVSLVDAQQASPTCDDPSIQATGAFDPDWAQAVTEACAHARGLTDRDPGARLFLEADPSGTGVRVRLELVDGRKTVRVVRVPEELGRVMEALITLPPSVNEAHAPPPPAPPAKAPPAKAAPQRAVEAPSAPIPLAYDLAILGTTRALGPNARVALGLVGSGDIDIDDGWIVGLRLRADVASFDLEDEGELDLVTFGGGVEAARRVPVARVAAIDLGVGVDGLADVPIGGGRGGRRSDDVEGDVRARAFAKVWAPAPGVSFTGLLGFELSPLRIGDDGKMPAFGGEVGAGVGWAGL